MQGELVEPCNSQGHLLNSMRLKEFSQIRKMDEKTQSFVLGRITSETAAGWNTGYLGYPVFQRGIRKWQRSDRISPCAILDKAFLISFFCCCCCRSMIKRLPSLPIYKYCIFSLLARFSFWQYWGDTWPLNWGDLKKISWTAGWDHTRLPELYDRSKKRGLYGPQVW